MNRVVPAVILLAALPAEAQDGRFPPLELRYGGHRLVVPARDQHGPHNWYDDACRGGIERIFVHAVTRRGDTCYVVFTCEGWSRGGPSSRGRCGSGWERQINWMTIRDGAVIAHQRNDIDSCWVDTCGSIDGWRKGVLAWGAEAATTGYSAFYDPEAPEKGLQSKETYYLPRQ